MPKAARIGDPYDDINGNEKQAGGSDNVFINGIGVARLGDNTAGHSVPGHGTYPPAAINSASPNVFANGKAIARVGDTHAAHICSSHAGHPHAGAITSGSPDVTIN